MTKHVRQTIVLLAKLRCAADSDRTVRGGDLCRGAPPPPARSRRFNPRRPSGILNGAALLAVIIFSRLWPSVLPANMIPW